MSVLVTVDLQDLFIPPLVREGTQSLPSVFVKSYNPNVIIAPTCVSFRTRSSNSTSGRPLVASGSAPGQTLLDAPFPSRLLPLWVSAGGGSRSAVSLVRPEAQTVPSSHRELGPRH